MNADSQSPTPEAIIHQLKADIASGENWYLALLKAVRDWPLAEEAVNGETYRYLIAGEALDLNVLTQRLLTAVGDLVPEDEQLNLLFRNRPPVELSVERFKELLGEARYKQYLNYFYGITAEEALIQAVEDDLRKANHGIKARSEHGYAEEAYREIYGDGEKELLHLFRKEKGYPQAAAISLTEMREFTYWLFKYRLAHSDKERLASDTRKALNWLKKNAPR